MSDGGPVVCVVGSANLDSIYDVVRIPGPGETVLATGEQRAPGGKGLNQAVAAARAGAAVTFIGALGSDDAGQTLRRTLTDSGVAVDLMRSVDVPTGSAVVLRAADGENAIVVAAGANADISSLTAGEADAVSRARVVLLQQETPASGVRAAVASAHAAGAVVVMNAAPAAAMAADVLDGITVLVVNEHELSAQLPDVARPNGLDAGREPALASVAAQARQLVTAQRSVVVTLGSRGAVCVDADGATHVPAPPAGQVVDTTGAGDAFCGALAAALARGDQLVHAAEYGCAAGTVAVSGLGAAPSMGSAAQIEAAMVTAPSSRPVEIQE